MTSKSGTMHLAISSAMERIPFAMAVVTRDTSSSGAIAASQTLAPVTRQILTVPKGGSVKAAAMVSIMEERRELTTLIVEVINQCS